MKKVWTSGIPWEFPYGTHNPDTFIDKPINGCIETI
jgi:hypothetical protein